MGTRTRRRLRDGLVGLFVLTCAGMAQPVLAIAAPPATPSADAPALPSRTPSTRTTYSTRPTPFSVTVSPARLTIAQDAVDETQHVTVVNRGEDPVSLAVQLRNFVSMPDGGLSYRPDAPYGAAGWAHVSPTHLELQTGESALVDVSFDVPDKREPGDHQVALVFLAPSARAPGNIQVNRGIGAPVYVTVPGAVDDSVRLDALSAPRWLWNGHGAEVTASLSSTGTVHRDFRGETALAVGTHGHLGRFGDFTVARGADRVVSTTWDAPLVCVCHPSVTVTNSDGAAQTLSTRVVVLPWWALAGLAVLVLAVTTVLLRRRRTASRPRTARGSAVPAAGESG